MRSAGRSEASIRRALLPLLGAALVLAACGGDDGFQPTPGLSIQKAAPSGDNQTDTVLATLANPFRVVVLRGTAAARDVAVAWRADSGSSVVTTTTDASGIAEFRRTLGQYAGTYRAEASVPDAVGSPATFTATANPGKPTTVRYVSGNNQTDTTNARLGTDYTVRVTDSYDNGVGGVVIDWAVTAGGGSIAPTRSTTQVGSGYASARHTLGPGGAQAVTATASALSGAPGVTFTAVMLGTLRVTTTTTGVDGDPNGYSVSADGATRDTTAAVAANGMVTMRLYPGDYGVTLGGVAANCDVTSPSLGTVTVPSGGTAAVVFGVECAAATLLAYVSHAGGNRDVYAIQSNGTGATQLTGNTAWDAEPAWSPDGTKIAFRSNHEIYVMNASGLNVVQLTDTAPPDYHPTWSRDGAQIAFVSERAGNAEIYVMSAADGTNVVRLTNDTAYDADPAWSPDGSKIAFQRGACDSYGCSGDIYIMNSDGSAETRLTTGGGAAQPAWSPDGTRLAFSRIATCDYNSYYYYCERDLFVMNAADGSGVRELTWGPDDHNDPTWSPDGRWIAFAASPCAYDYYYGCSYFAYVIKAVRENGASLTEVTSSYGVEPAWRR